MTGDRPYSELNDDELLFVYHAMMNHRRSWERGCWKGSCLKFDVSIVDRLQAEIARRWPYGKY